MVATLCSLGAATGRPCAAASQWPARCRLLPPRRPRISTTRVRVISQQEPRPDGVGGGSGGGGGRGVQKEMEKELQKVIQMAIEEYDKSCTQTNDQLENAVQQLREMDEQILEMKDEALMPSWAFSLMAWTRRQLSDAVDGHRKVYDALRARRGEYVAGLQQLEAELRRDPDGLLDPNEMTAEFMGLAGYNWAVQEGGDASSEELLQRLRDAMEQTSGPNAVMWSAVLGSLITSWLAAWVGSWWGVDAYRLLHEPLDWQAAAPGWLAWTVPYVIGTLGVYFIRPTTITKVALRPVSSDQQQFYRRIPAYAFASAALVVAYCQCLTYQGLWQELLTGWLGGSRDPLLLTDPSAIESGMRASMGSLVGSPVLPAFLLLPAAAVLTGVVEGGNYYLAMALRDTTVIDLGGGEKLESSMWQDGPFGKLGPGALTPEELSLVAARVALASTYLSLEATLTGCLWLPVGTSAAGILTAILLARGSSGGGGSRS